MTTQGTRLAGMDELKGLACATIVLHHLAFYGPMADVLEPFIPGLIGGLYEYGRWAVQVFLVMAGFLVASSLASQSQGAVPAQPARSLIVRRMQRLLPAYFVALSVSLIVNAAVRPWFGHASVSPPPTWPQLAAHALLLQDVLQQEALSAGLWYVAIDLQLFALTVLLWALAGKVAGASTGAQARLAAALVVLLAAASLAVFNRRSGLDVTALYFFGAYALGMMAFWASAESSRQHGMRWVLLIAVLCCIALWIELRGRLVLALAVALALIWMRWLARREVNLPPFAWLRSLGRISYSVFLIHFPVCLLVNAVVTHFWPSQWLPNAVGLVAAFTLSILAGSVLYRSVESRTFWQPRRRGASA